MTLTLKQGVTLNARVYEHDSAAKAVVIINPAVAVPARFYRHFARYLSQNGYVVIAYDYRGIGESLLPRGEKTDLMTWATKDYATVVDFARSTYQDKDIYLVGHSFGGQLPRLCAHTRYVEGILAISAQSGYWRLWPIPQRFALFGLWYLLMPLSSSLLGFFPTKLLKLGENLPAGAALQWARWCRNEDYFLQDVDRIDYLDMNQLNIIFVGFSDDWMAPKTSIEALKPMYAGANQKSEYLSPEQFQLKKIGHFGFFTQSMRDVLWPRSLEWLDQLQAASLTSDKV